MITGIRFLHYYLEFAIKSVTLLDLKRSALLLAAQRVIVDMISDRLPFLFLFVVAFERPSTQIKAIRIRMSQRIATRLDLHRFERHRNVRILRVDRLERLDRLSLDELLRFVAFLQLRTLNLYMFRMRPIRRRHVLSAQVINQSISISIRFVFEHSTQRRQRRQGRQRRRSRGNDAESIDACIQLVFGVEANVHFDVHVEVVRRRRFVLQCALSEVDDRSFSVHSIDVCIFHHFIARIDRILHVALFVLQFLCFLLVFRFLLLFDVEQLGL
mmetsp:Transcript_52761/g.84057  ORF Transcript_52761/g.84057 Transcript_52761/m.84057 type:complete len:271 (+) Transcript_52761:340-1152(+)